MGSFDNEGGYEYVVIGAICETSVPSSQFCCSKKIKSFFQKSVYLLGYVFSSNTFMALFFLYLYLLI